MCGISHKVLISHGKSSDAMLPFESVIISANFLNGKNKINVTNPESEI